MWHGIRIVLTAVYISHFSVWSFRILQITELLYYRFCNKKHASRKVVVSKYRHVIVMVNMNINVLENSPEFNKTVDSQTPRTFYKENDWYL